SAPKVGPRRFGDLKQDTSHARPGRVGRVDAERGARGAAGSSNDGKSNSPSFGSASHSDSHAAVSDSQELEIRVRNTFLDLKVKTESDELPVRRSRSCPR
ncbi:unnamed protein product, partial [Effrenium voratum]